MITLRVFICCSWNLPNPSEYALRFNSPSHQGFVTERVGDLLYSLYEGHYCDVI